MARRYRQVTDLYVTGAVAVLRDDSPVWMQALNPFEQDTARNEAQIAKARIIMAIKEFGSDEQAKVRYFFMEDGLDVARAKVVDAKVSESVPKIIERLRNDSEWSEKLLILERGLDNTALIPETEEFILLEKLAEEYNQELAERLASERAFNQMTLAEVAEEQLWVQYLDWYLSRRANEIMLAEYQLHQVLFGARVCEASHDGKNWDHTGCNGHRDRIFGDSEEVRSAPEQLFALLLEAAEVVEMSARDAKNSDRQWSSNGSSPLPSEEGASTASTPTETQAELPGTSSLLSATH